MRGQDLNRLFVGGVDDLTDGLIDFKGDFRGEVPLSVGVVTAKEDRAAILLVLDRAQARTYRTR
jgi:hypothetical protein